MSVESNDPRLALVFGRRSIRSFSSETVDDELLHTILAAAMAAPSAVARDPWRFVVLRESESREKVAAGLPNGKFLTQAPLGIVVCGELAAAHDGVQGYLVQDCSAAMENLLIAVHGLGLGACWLGVYPRKERQAHLAQVLNLPDGVEAVGVAAVGFPAEQKKPRSRYREEFVHYEGWQA